MENLLLNPKWALISYKTQIEQIDQKEQHRLQFGRQTNYRCSQILFVVRCYLLDPFRQLLFIEAGRLFTGAVRLITGIVTCYLLAQARY